MNDEFRIVAGSLYDARNYREVFPEGNEVSIKSTFRQMARIIHPDRVPSSQKAEASAAFDKLNQFYQAALAAVKDGTFAKSKPLMPSFQSGAWRHECDEKLATDFDMTLGYAARSTRGGSTTKTIVKIAKTPHDNELLATEAAALKKLNVLGEEFRHFFPGLIDSFLVVDGRRRLGANAITYLDGFVNLEAVRRRYTNGLHPLDMAWIWRRILWSLGAAHEQGLLHGALVPSNILIHPAEHGVVLVDWCYSLAQSDGTFPSLKAAVGCRRDWCQTDILKRQSPTTAHDIALAARSMLFLMEGQRIPSVMRQYFDCLAGGKENKSAFELLGQFDKILERLGAPYYPRSFRPLNW